MKTLPITINREKMEKYELILEDENELNVNELISEVSQYVIKETTLKEENIINTDLLTLSSYTMGIGLHEWLKDEAILSPIAASKTSREHTLFLMILSFYLYKFIDKNNINLSIKKTKLTEEALKEIDIQELLANIYIRSEKSGLSNFIIIGYMMLNNEITDTQLEELKKKIPKLQEAIDEIMSQETIDTKNKKDDQMN